MVNLSNHHQIFRSGKSHSVIDIGLKSSILIEVDVLCSTGRHHPANIPEIQAEKPAPFDQLSMKCAGLHKKRAATPESETTQ
jgi:hypothetical protein